MTKVPSIPLRSRGQAATEANDGVRPTRRAVCLRRRGALVRGPMRLRRHARAYLFLLPSGLILLVFVVYPIVESLWMSLHNWSFFSSVQTFVGLQNYRTMVHDPRFWNALRNTAIYTVRSCRCRSAWGWRWPSPCSAIPWSTSSSGRVYFFPVISSLATMGIVWKFLLDPQIGIITHLLVRVGLPDIDFLESTTWALPAVMLVGVWKGVGFSMVIFLAALQDVPEVADRGGRPRRGGAVARFHRVVLPMLRPSMLFASVIATIASMQLFDSIYVMTGVARSSIPTRWSPTCTGARSITSSPATPPPSPGCCSC